MVPHWLMANLTQAWASRTLPVFEEFYAAIEQMALEAGAAGDSITQTGALDTAAPAVDLARERVAQAVATVRQCPPPPDPGSAHALALLLDALDDFTAAERFDKWVHTWTRAMDLSETFAAAVASATGQQPPCG